MGNFSQKMQKAKTLDQLEPTIKHLQQTRSDSQIEITDRLTYLLSDLNTERVNQHPEISSKNLDWSKYIFVCIQGFPAIKNQFQPLGLPGETVYFSTISFSEEALKSDEKTRQHYVYESTFKKQANRLHNLFQSITKQKIVLVYHSAGNFVLSMYFYYFGYEITKRIKGMIDIAGGPLRYYISAQMLVPVILQTDFSEVMENSDKVHKFFIKTISSTGFDLGFNTKYETLSFIHYIKSPDYGELFAATWNHPNVLKLFIHGRNDTLFQSRCLNQKVIYYTYKKSLQQNYEKSLADKYQKLYKAKRRPNNLQQKFIFAVPKGQHSLHRQERNHKLVRNATQQYLILIHQ